MTANPQSHSSMLLATRRSSLVTAPLEPLITRHCGSQAARHPSLATHVLLSTSANRNPSNLPGINDNRISNRLSNAPFRAAIPTDPAGHSSLIARHWISNRDTVIRKRRNPHQSSHFQISNRDRIKVLFVVSRSPMWDFQHQASSVQPPELRYNEP